jgi:thiamine-phosphate pyrophosphorylase
LLLPADPSHLLLCLVTDRRRLSGRDDERSAEAVVEQVAEAVRAGVDLVQVREPDLEGRRLYDLTLACVQAARGSPTRIIVNDRLDVALAAGADGVHLRSSSGPAARLRQGVPDGWLVGRSVHGATEAAAAEAEGGLDYLIVGTVFPSRSKPTSETVIGIAGLAQAVERVHLPVLAIGGVSLSSIPQLARAGARGLAAIGLFIPDEVAPHGGIGEVVPAVRRLFDTSRAIP